MPRVLLTLYDCAHLRHSLAVRLLFEPRDLWIGVYWTYEKFQNPSYWPRMFTLYLGVLPTLPIQLRLLF